MSLRVTAYPTDAACVVRLIADGQDLKIGRADNAGLRIVDPRVSRVHAQVRFIEGGWRVQDSASKNGVRLDGAPVVDAAIDGDLVWLSIGGVPVKIERVIADASSPDAGTEQGRRARAAQGAARLAAEASIDAMLSECLASAIEISGCARASLWTAAPEGEYSLVRRSGAPDPPESRSAMHRALAAGSPALVNDVAGVEALAHRESIVKGGIRAVIAAPLTISESIRGILYADSQEVGKAFTELDVELFDNLAEQAGICLAASTLRQAMSDSR